MHNEKSHPVLGLIAIVFIGLLCIGWVLNLIKLFACESTGCAAARLFGAFTGPVGGIMGWF
jgi:hypothetical protein